MFARKVSVLLKPGKLDSFLNVMERDVVPWLRNQQGFQELITLATPDESEIAIISFWEHEIHAEACEAIYPEVITALESLLDGPPYMKTFLVAGSTMPRFRAARMPASDAFRREPSQTAPTTYPANS
jgi:hypothetical protein